MKIQSIKTYQKSSSFEGKKSYAYISKNMAKNKVIDYVTKDVLENRPLKDENLRNENMLKEKAIIDSGTLVKDIDKLLKEMGITFCEAADNCINIACGHNNGFYKIQTILKLDTPHAKEYILKTLLNELDAFGGFTNYQSMVTDLKRQDIIQKGLKIHTYELNNNLSKTKRQEAVKKLSLITKKKLKLENLFFIESDAFYYDKLTKTAYSINLANQMEYTKPIPNICSFITNQKGQVIGYKNKSWDLYSRNMLEKEYIEQQEPSVKLPSIVGMQNNKEFAEAFRFGNASKDEKLSNGIPVVLEHLANKANIYATESELQLIKFFNKDNRITRRIGYYDSSTGNSIIYNEDGKYMYQLEYNKDPFGNIIANSRL